MSHKTLFPNPLDEATLAAFCHPSPRHPFHKPVLSDGDVLAANGYVALRAHRGRWLDSDFDGPTPAQTLRLDRLAWSAFDTLRSNCWDATDDQKGMIFRSGPIGFWAVDEDSSATGKPSPTPIWKVGSAAPVRLSLLQLIARLPRCEVFTGPQAPNQPLYFRCTGARGIIAVDARLELTSCHLFAHLSYDAMSDRVVTRPRTNTLRETMTRCMREGGVKPPVIEDLSESVTIVRED
jgi:hypothetical protein